MDQLQVTSQLHQNHMPVDQSQRLNLNVNLNLNMNMNMNSRGGGYEIWKFNRMKFNFKNQNANPSGNVQSSSTTWNSRNWNVKKPIDVKINNNWKESPASYNRLKAKRYFFKKKFNHVSKSAPFAPRNTTSFLIRAKKSGGIASLISPSPVTPAVLPTPIFSPSREALVDTAKEEWGVDGYGSMKGLIRLKSPANESDEGTLSSESDVEEHLEVEKRLNQDLSRFEMIYPNSNNGVANSYVLENRVDDQDSHISQLEEENLMLKERLFFMEREFDNLRTRLQSLEMQRQ